MKERSIPCKDPEVKAIIDGQQTMIRRAIKPQPNYGQEFIGMSFVWDGKSQAEFETPPLFPGASMYHPLCPYGQPGDRLWVKEEWGVAPCNNSFPPSEIPLSSARHVDYKADEERYWSVHVDKWRPSIFMPRWASRITLEIVDVWVERLQEITDEDIWNEGAIFNKGIESYHAQSKFKALWDFTNGKEYPWKNNPWVWCIKFKKL